MITVDVKELAKAIVAELDIPQASRWMNTTDAAEYVRCSEKWARDHLPHRRVDGKLLFDRHEIDEWLTNHPRR